eukprot:3754386-Rhodomonas_salina.3
MSAQTLPLQPAVTAQSEALLQALTAGFASASNKQGRRQHSSASGQAEADLRLFARPLGVRG